MATPSVDVQVGELRGKLEGVDKHLDDMNRLLLLVIAISGGSLATAVVGIILK